MKINILEIWVAFQFIFICLFLSDTNTYKGLLLSVYKKYDKSIWDFVLFHLLLT